MRRIQAESLTGTAQPFVSEDFSVDFDNRRVVVNGEPVNLTPTEYKLLCYPLRNPRQILTKDAILNEMFSSNRVV